MEQERGRSARGLSVKQAEKARRRAEERVLGLRGERAS